MSIEKLDIDEIIAGNFSPKDYNDTVNKLNELIDELNKLKVSEMITTEKGKSTHLNLIGVEKQD
jgi:hypothetical protein